MEGILEEREIRRGLMERVKQIYQETYNRIRVCDQESRVFWTTKRVRQGLLRLLLFSVFNRFGGGDGQRVDR